MTAKIDKENLRTQIQSARGYWHPFHEGLLEHAPEYLQAYLEFQDAPAQSGFLDPKVREFLYIAADCAVSHLYTTGLARHIELAFDAGATPAEVLEVIQLTMLTSHAPHDMGLPLLESELKKREIDLPDLNDEQTTIRVSLLCEVYSPG